MKQNKVSRDLPGWAGSTPDDFLLADYDIAEEMKASSWKRLYELKHKLIDDHYLDGAIASIAEMLSNRVKGKSR
ncbi:MAG: hypothetical protein ACOYVH_02290 [Spirochaetota bacterium]|jgi:hypothetical protein|uniref:Uncharacterized protein n=1 Tax=uncultured spirochete TaxID=156406 RepID=A0A3P3XKW5_9SPIR|nr:hypothetical protein [Rectinema subterraneum]SLM15073.1 hypothetical protein SPIROBIBN47_380058 [uncultured spirochete]HBE46009.1 hypothetical protein [Spirochaetaceae bacterium]HCX95930.1 hypothetical protein [Spirochaetaceae bacterium]